MLKLYYSQLVSESSFKTLYPWFLSMFGHNLQRYISARCNWHHRQASCVAYALLAHFVEEVEGRPFLDVSFDAFGKPFFTKDMPYFFSVSHSKDYVVVLVSDMVVGVDIEYIGAKSYMPIAKRFFAQQEYDFLYSLTEEEVQKRAFYNLWTLKESYVKALGKGLRIPLSSFVFEQKAEGLWHMTVPAVFEGDKFNFRLLEVLPNYSGAICTPSVEPIVIEKRVAKSLATRS